jgi:hypothetical protein
MTNLFCARGFKREHHFDVRGSDRVLLFDSGQLNARSAIAGFCRDIGCYFSS